MQAAIKGSMKPAPTAKMTPPTVALCVAVLLTVLVCRGAEPASLVVLNGRVITMDERNSLAQAVAIRDGRFVRVGTDDEVRAFVGPDTRVWDAGGQSVVPGLFETHVHAVGVARDQLDEPFRQLSSLAETKAWVREKAARTPAGEWIRILRVDLTRFQEGRFPTRGELDDMLADRPLVFDWSYAGINQVQVLNTAALAAAGITRSTPDPKDGRIMRDAQGNPTGMLRNARALVADYLPKPPAISKPRLLQELERVHASYSSLGFTSITERRSDPEVYALYDELKQQGRLKVRTTVTIGVGYQGTGNALKQIANLPLKPGEGDEWLQVGPLKIRIDGGLLYGTAYLREPFLAEGSARYYNLPSAANRGELMTPYADIEAIIRAGHKAGWQMSAHVAGDAGVDRVLDALEAADRDSPIAPRRFNLIHAYLPNAETARRAARLGAVVDTQPVMYYKDGDALRETLGAERAARMYGLKEWLQGGVKVAINADHMMGLEPDHALQPYNPFLALYIAVTRRTESGRIHGPEQRVSRLEALRMMTTDAAYLSFDEKRRGSIEVGKLGDLAVLTGDYLECSEDEIRRLQVAATIIGGTIVYSRSPAPGSISSR
jgi:predicted amidohydrolase YtcJ